MAGSRYALSQKLEGQGHRVIMLNNRHHGSAYQYNCLVSRFSSLRVLNIETKSDEDRSYPSQCHLRLVLDLATPDGCKAELVQCQIIV